LLSSSAEIGAITLGMGLGNALAVSDS